MDEKTNNIPVDIGYLTDNLFGIKPESYDFGGFVESKEIRTKALPSELKFKNETILYNSFQGK